MGPNIGSESIPLTWDADGTVRVGGTRVTLESVVTVFEEGATPEEIVQKFDTLNLADVYAVLTYYLRHRKEVVVYLNQQNDAANALREELEQRFPTNQIRQRLENRRKRGPSVC